MSVVALVDSGELWKSLGQTLGPAPDPFTADPTTQVKSRLTKLERARKDIKKAKAAHARLYANKVKKPPKISPARIAAKRKHDKVKVEEWEANLFHVIQMAIRHKRTLYGRTVKDVKSLFDIIDRDGDRKLTLRKVSDAFRRLGLGLR